MKISSFFLFFSDGCPLLSQLNISWCDQISDNGIEALARGCKELNTLRCKGCVMVSNLREISFMVKVVFVCSLCFGDAMTSYCDNYEMTKGFVNIGFVNEVVDND